MRKFILAITIPLALIGAFFWRANLSQERETAQISTDIVENTETLQPKYVNLEVPYINEAPENIWTGSWKNACEEATIAMVDKYYQGVKSVSIPEAKISLQALFDVQQKDYGSDANSDAARTAEIINNYASFKAAVITDPTIEMIKEELDYGRPVIAFHRGFDLQNPNIPFLRTGSSYHTTVIKGYDEARKIFITNDPGDTKAGPDHIYDYDLYLKSIHDYRYSSKLADGPARVIFSQAKK